MQPHGLFHFLDVGTQIVDAVAVIAGVVRFQPVDGTEAVLHDEQRLLVPLVEGGQCVALMMLSLPTASQMSAASFV